MLDKDFIDLYGDDYYKQLALEQEAQDAARDLLQRSIEKAVADGTADETATGQRIIRYAWDECRKAVAAVIEWGDKKRKGAPPKYVPLLQKLLTAYPTAEDRARFIDTCTLATVSHCLTAALDMSGQSNVSKTAALISRTIIDEANVEKYAQEAPLTDIEEHGVSPEKLRQRMSDGLAKRVWDSYRRVYLIHTMQKSGVEPFRTDAQSKTYLGAKLIEAVVTGESLFVLGTDSESGLTRLLPSPWLRDTWERNNALLLASAHQFTPTIIPPRPWESPYQGSYYGASAKYTSLLRLHGAVSNQFIKSYKRKLLTVDLSAIYRAINGLQNTPFRINKDILSVVNSIYTSGGGLGKIPRTEPLAPLARLPETCTPEELKEHKKKAVVQIKQETARRTKALRAYMTINAAKQYAAYDKIYFPWNMDYRGRLYPIPTAIHPQGDDMQKALLEFAEPSALQHEDDWKWLAIHGANCAGEDKKPFDERIQFVKENEQNIIDSARDPLGVTWWSTIAENDYPLEFLAFCFEWVRLTKYMQEKNTCVGFVCHIPIAFDGTCSGLQHFSAILRDEIGGHAVNLTPSDTKQDIYGIVAEKVNVRLLQDAVSGTPDTDKRDKKTGKVVKNADGTARIQYGTRSLAQTWIVFNREKFGTDGITRKVCKRSVMTLAYGSGRYGFKENLIADIIKPFNSEHPDDTPFTANTTQAAVYMASLIWDAVKGTVVKAVEGMDYLQKLAKLICKDGNVVTWTTPDGLPIQQSYMEREQKVIGLYIQNKHVRFYFMEDKGTVAQREQAQGIAPNFIHSRDASHMRHVINAALDEGITNFEMIHDSFSTDLAHAGRLFEIVRESFVTLYDGQDVLADFLSDVSYALPNNTELPEKPSFGTLVLSDVKSSKFCFS